MKNSEPCIIDENSDYAVVRKPPKFHSTPLKNNSENISDWFRQKYSSGFNLVHRLDFETHGLLLIAKNTNTYEFFKTAQEKGEFVKEYSLETYNAIINNKQGFPPLPFADINESIRECSPESPFVIYSFFRPFGQGRKQVRPVLQERKNYETAKDKGNFYKTEIINRNENFFTVRLKRGFRHQIRCHFFWIGYPILNDPVYNADGSTASGTLALRAHALFFPDPKTGEQREYRVESLGNKDFITS